MKKLVTILGALLISFTANAKDTDDIRNALIQVRQSVETALKQLDQTRFSEEASVENTEKEQCSGNPVSVVPNQQILSMVNYLKNRTLAKCGASCASSVKYDFKETSISTWGIGTCKITVVSNK